MFKHLFVKVSLLSYLIVIGISCAPRQELMPYSNLIDRGLLPVSTTNPYLGANLFLSAEAQRSGYMYNFLKGRGGPVAIALESSNFGATSLLMYYPKDREVYRAELQPLQRGNLEFNEWLVRGPYAIERRDYRELARLDGSLVGEPVFVVHGKTTRFSQQKSFPGLEREQRTNTSSLNYGTGNSGNAIEPILVPVVPTPKPLKKRSVITKPRNSAAEEAKAKSEADTPLNSDQQALRLAQGLVERDNNGAGVHIVISDQQTLAKLAQWYTGDEKNAAAIATASGIEKGKEPSLASRVIIPKNLLSNEKRLAE